MIRFRHVYVIQRTEEEGSPTYTAIFPALPNVGGISDTPDGAISALRAALIGVLKDIEDESELPDSLEPGEIVGFGVLEATSDDELPLGEDDELPLEEVSEE
jgi:predicted RNase H-like HicB family nuclease